MTNPLGSSEPKDMVFNAKNLDVAVNGTDLTFIDRFGVTRYSIARLHTMIATALTEVDPTVTAAKNAVNDFRDESIADMRETAANLGNDLNNKYYTSYFGERGMVSDPQDRDAVVGIVNGDPDPDLDGWYAYRLSSNAWVRFPDQPVSESKLLKVTEGIQKKTVRPQFVPAFLDEAGKVPAWFHNGAFEVKEIGPGTAAQVSDIAGTAFVGSGSKFIPIFFDEKKKVAVWLEDGKLSAVGLSDSLKATLGLGRQYAPANGPVSSALPVATDGRSLFLWRAGLAKIKAGLGSARLLITGDSWTEYVAIPQQLATLLHGLFGKSGEGWISVNGLYMLNGVTLAKTGWTIYDASTGATPAYGTGIDGMYITATTTTATLSIGNARATNFDIYYRAHGGTFRWRVDGGAWNVVAADGSGALKKVSISGLADAVHGLEIDTTGNAGTVVLCGFRAYSPATYGVELLKAGNAGLDGEQLARFTGNISPIAVDFAPDVVVVILGSNDYRRSSTTVEKYIEGLTALVAQYRIASPSCAFVFIAPADSNGVAIRPLTNYRDALYAFCIANGHEFYNMHDEWGSFAKMNALGMWVDTLHLNDTGAYSLASRLLSKFLN